MEQGLKLCIQVEAAKIGSEAEVKKLLDQGEDPNSHEDSKVRVYTEVLTT